MVRQLFLIEEDLAAWARAATAIEEDTAAWQSQVRSHVYHFKHSVICSADTSSRFNHRRLVAEDTMRSGPVDDLLCVL